MNRLYTVGVLAALAFVMYSASLVRAQEAQEYDIRLTRRYNVGDKYRLSASGRHTEKMVVFIGPTPVNPKVDEFSVDLIATLTAVEIDDLGRVTKFTMQIESCAGSIGGVTKALFSPGAIINGATESSRIILTMDNAHLDPMTAKIIALVIPSHHSSGVTDDDVFGTREKKSVGDTWSIHGDVAKKALKETFNMEGDIRGATTLDGVVRGGEGDFLVVSAWLDMSNLSLPLPDGIEIQRGQAKSTFSGRFPTGQGRQPLSQSMKMTAWFVAHRPADPKTSEMLVQGVFERSLRREFEPMK